MLVFLNGKFVSEECAVISILDRGFMYGDGVFELLRVANGQPFRWQEHWARLQAGADFLRLTLPFASLAMRQYGGQLVTANRTSDGLLRVQVSRGVGHRGYSPKGADHPTVCMSIHAAPPKPAGWRLVTSSIRLRSEDPLNAFKTCNKLPQVLAKTEADAAGADEALLLNSEGHIVEGSSSNLFWIAQGRVHTPPLCSGALPGVTRAAVLELCRSLGLGTQEQSPTTLELTKADGVFLSLSSAGIVEGVALNGTALSRSLVTHRLRDAYEELVRGDTGVASQDLD